MENVHLGVEKADMLTCGDSGEPQINATPCIDALPHLYERPNLRRARTKIRPREFEQTGTAPDFRIIHSCYLLSQ